MAVTEMVEEKTELPKVMLRVKSASRMVISHLRQIGKSMGDSVALVPSSREG